ncbi:MULTISPECIES: D-tagatose-bisphosphate aldolase, class II, non-catalytic subunit [unclassified Oceanispirochaeta]|uniref:D-tagatose-bisphosphate aldolase, class II, non-catalytic subunit n=1 Tax=unclassified Oceanispirochaeta TaxID=2635722 RepID=UPI000E0968C1|nr:MULTISPECIES: D-tagatose-bisphosphate aldolase, class II, non-catalytic subunit [unclassified Oceanispirochaeta]MBF9014924.1 D-tagatose-bisphosphate aldolase, class II, non-catalytic subunit [Oceanispirochaeta sp. M2]NPD71395.1 D-tagatose-bisphosphate aldolase, class II, non-catalytic subunit [Oceanispirochaeta sp. M1]RDG33360.1 D-tagatose-bisphosphate aldolase, class II, non-catalytic subunit [Oceanispirochaeta sp. M1]
MSATSEFLQLMKDNKAGRGTGLYSVCSAHADVIRACMLQAKSDGSIVLIESTSNQVDQFGGYTGMVPSEFVEYVKGLSSETGFPFEKVLLGGDHLGPNAWQNEPAAEAMSKARDLIAAYVKAGYKKIHLDASMFCADDEGDRHQPLADEVVSARAAELCAVAEKSYAESFGGSSDIIYVIGTEVPIPGGAQEEEDTVTPTPASNAKNTIALTRAAFDAQGLQDAWKRVIGLVVQPGVEFGDDQVFHYDSKAAADLSAMIEGNDQFVYEAHSTDYQSESGLTQLVKDHYCILKVGPWLTFAYREALFALEDMEKELLGGTDTKLSGLREILEKTMLDKPGYWQKYYPGNESQQFFKRKYSFSDRSRYYWPDKNLNASVELLKRNLNDHGMSLSLLSQSMPNQYNALQEGQIKLTAEDLIISRIRDVAGIYARACGFGKCC